MAAIAFRTSTPKSGFSLASMFGAIAVWNDARLTRNALNRLTNRELDDIGLVRSDIEKIVNGTLIR